MGNCTKATSPQSQPERPGRINYAPDHQTPISGPTLQRKVSPKIEITITRRQLAEAKWLFSQSGDSKPGWLRQKFYINQCRRKRLNDVLAEAQLDRAFCGRYRNTEEWYDLLHLLWHDINGEPTCR